MVGEPEFFINFAQIIIKCANCIPLNCKYGKQDER